MFDFKFYNKGRFSIFRNGGYQGKKIIVFPITHIYIWTSRQKVKRNFQTHAGLSEMQFLSHNKGVHKIGGDYLMLSQ